MSQNTATENTAREPLWKRLDREWKAIRDVPVEIGPDHPFAALNAKIKIKKKEEPLPGGEGPGRKYSCKNRILAEDRRFLLTRVGNPGEDY